MRGKLVAIKSDAQLTLMRTTVAYSQTKHFCMCDLWYPPNALLLSRGILRPCNLQLFEILKKVNIKLLLYCASVLN
jgi:hypothetical protein